MMRGDQWRGRERGEREDYVRGKERDERVMQLRYASTWIIIAAIITSFIQQFMA